MHHNNRHALRLMLSCQTQWRASFGGVTGLDYNAMFQVAAALGLKIDAAMLGKIGVLEGLTLKGLNK